MEIREAPKIKVNKNKVLVKDKNGIKKEIFEILKEMNVPLDTYLNNIETLKFKKVTQEDFNRKFPNNSYDQNVANSYSITNNTIYYQPEFIHNKVKHEFFHVASAYYDNKYIYYGFSQIDTRNGEFLNLGMMEAYTQYLYKKYTNDNEEDNVYIFNITLIMPLVNMLGEETLNKYYFNMDLEGLIKELEKYVTYKDIIGLMKALDYILYNYRNSNIITQYKFVNFYNYAKKVITAILLSGAYQNYYNKYISKEDMKEILYDLRNFYMCNIHSKKFPFISRQESKESFEKFYKNIRILVKERYF